MEKQPIHLTPQEIDDLLGQLNDSARETVLHLMSDKTTEWVRGQYIGRIYMGPQGDDYWTGSIQGDVAAMKLLWNAQPEKTKIELSEREGWDGTIASFKQIDNWGTLEELLELSKKMIPRSGDKLLFDNALKFDENHQTMIVKGVVRHDRQSRVLLHKPHSKYMEEVSMANLIRNYNINGKDLQIAMLRQNITDALRGKVTSNDQYQYIHMVKDMDIKPKITKYPPYIIGGTVDGEKFKPKLMSQEHASSYALLSKKKDNIDNIKRYAFIMTFAPKLADIVISKIRPDLAKAQEQNKTKSLTR